MGEPETAYYAHIEAEKGCLSMDKGEECWIVRPGSLHLTVQTKELTPGAI